ncbi:MAG: response regulator [Desulfuromonadales bacterium]|nr:response regulator [Desulfuromonadales bacterium]
MAKRILLAEDNQQLAAAIVERLKQQGFDVLQVSDGIAALRAIAAQPPELLLLELKLPGLHGIELIKKLRQSPRTSNLPVIVLTGFYKGEKFQAAARALGIRHYLEKPLKTVDLMAAIHQALNLTSSPTAASTDEARPFPQHLRTAFLKHFSGLLTLKYPDTSRLLTFINGAPVALRPGFISRDFGDFLCRRGQITAAEYDYFTTTAAFRHDSLVQIGCLQYNDLLQAEMDYLSQELLCAFNSGPAQANWKAIPAPQGLQLMTLNVPQLFYEGFHKHAGKTAAQLVKTFHGKYLLLDCSYYRHINFLRLDEAEKRFIQKINGQCTLGELFDDNFDVGPLLLTLTNLNMARFAVEPSPSADSGNLPLRTLFNAVEEEVEVVEILESFTDLVDDSDDRADSVSLATAAQTGIRSAAPAALKPGKADDLPQEVRLITKSLEGKSHYEVFGIKQAKFSITLLKERYFAFTRKFGPEVLMQLGGDDARLVEDILAKVATAYDTLSDVVKKERYDEMFGADRIGLGYEGDDRFQAQVQAESGKVFLEMEEWDNAEKALQEAVNAEPNNGDYLASLAWAIYRNPDYANSSAMMNKAKQMLNKAISMERTAQAFAYKGWMLLEAGQESMAEAEFNKALKQDARQSMARRGLRTLQEQQEQQKRGLFKRMFR